MRIAIMTDTNSGISVNMGKYLDLYVLPMPVMVDGVNYLEDINISSSQLFNAMKNNLEVASSQPSPESITNMWDEIFDNGYEEIVYVPMSSGLGDSYHTAAKLAGEYNSKVQVVDNHRISVPLADSVLDAKHMADKGMNAKEIKQHLEMNAYQSSIYIAVNSLEPLKKSGRITPTAATIATAINLKPILTIQGEKLDFYATACGTHQIEKKMIDAIKQDLHKRFPNIPAHLISIGTAGTFDSHEAADKWYHQVEAAFPKYSVRYNPLSCNIATHVGVNAMGICVSVTERQ